jgi:2,4-dienoyl-CoA reductase-like NADH-dependent reductase (Old Yellow Enzyme family)/NADPH-dependent 2,4-dienoyl-CoA reductase/sulfur reductase-like enzyme
MTTKYTRIFQPAKIGNLEIKHRLCNSPAIPNFSTRNGELTQREIDFYVEKAKGGFAIIFLSATSINPTTAKAYVCQPALYSDDFIPKYRELTDAIHEYGAKVNIQIYHAGRSTHPAFTGGKPAEAPQDTPCPFLSTKFPGYEIEVMSTQRIKEVVQEFAETARRVKEAGFDMVEIHGAHGYLPCSFVSPFYGERPIDDEYKGTYRENKLIFHRQDLNAIKEKCGPDFPVGIRFNAEEFVDDGTNIEDGIEIAKALEEMGFDYLGVSAGVYLIEILHLLIPTHYVPPFHFEPLAAAIKEAVSIPIMQYGRISSPEMAEAVLERGTADFVQMNRASWVDPHLPNKAMEGREEELRSCIYCNNGCLDRLWAGLDTSCTMNPEVGREREFNEKLQQPASEKKKVVIVGGGPGGMSCARYAKLRGHDAILFEARADLGGINQYACKGPKREEFGEITNYYSSEVRKLGADLRLGTEATAETVLAENPDVVVVATGSFPKIPIINGIRKPDGTLAEGVVTAWEALGGEKEIGEKVVIVGGNHIGVQTALLLREQNKQVTIVEALMELNPDMDGPCTWDGYLKPELKNQDVEVITSSYVKAFTGTSVLYEPAGLVPHALDVGVLKTAYAEAEIPCDTLVVGTGREPNNSLFKSLEGKVKNLHAIGDCVKPRWSYNATGEGASVAIDL